MKYREYVELQCGARLHLQLIDPIGISGYRRGGIGIALKQPCVQIIATIAKNIHKKGFIENTKYLKELVLETNLAGNIHKARIFIKSSIPSHVGLGSGTLHRTLIRKALSELFNIKRNRYSLSSLTGVGQYATLYGGLVVVSPVPKNTLIPSQVIRGDEGIRITPNLIGSFKLPKSWKVILCIPKKASVHGLSEVEEFQFYSNLKAPKNSEVYKVSFEILAKLIPAIQFQDFHKFEEAMNLITMLSWKRYEKNLNKLYWHKTSRAMYDIGANFVGLTSGGPTTFTLLNSKEHNMKKIKLQLETILANDSTIVISDINNEGLTYKNFSEYTY